MSKISDPERVKPALSDLDFPAGKDEIVDHAERTGAAREVIAALRALPLAEYANAAEVVRSVPAAPGGGDEEGDHQAGKRRHHTRDRLAEHMKDTERPPIEEELGENRGS